MASLASTAAAPAAGAGAPSPYLFELKSVQAPTFKAVVDALKEILIEVNLEIDETGIKVVALDNTHVVLVHLKLEADRFEKFYCERKLFIGISILKLYLLLKTITSGDILTLYVEKDDPNRLGIRIENSEKCMRTVYKLSTLDINVLGISIPPADFSTIISMGSAEFQKIIRDAHNLSDFIEIRNVENQLTFACQGDFASQETTISADKNQNVQISKPTSRGHEIIQGVYSLKYLSLFCKCTSLSPTVELFMRNSFPIVIRYAVASLGEIKLCLVETESGDRPPTA